MDILLENPPVFNGRTCRVEFGEDAKITNSVNPKGKFQDTTADDAEADEVSAMRSVVPEPRPEDSCRIYLTGLPKEITVERFQETIMSNFPDELYESFDVGAL